MRWQAILAAGRGWRRTINALAGFLDLFVLPDVATARPSRLSITSLWENPFADAVWANACCTPPWTTPVANRPPKSMSGRILTMRARSSCTRAWGLPSERCCSNWTRPGGDDSAPRK